MLAFVVALRRKRARVICYPPHALRNVRVLLLVLLAIMLPVRGVMAAAMLCPPSAGAASGEAHAHAGYATGASQHSHADAGSPDIGSHHAMQADLGAAGHADDGAAGPDTCNLCSACCSVPPLPSAAPAMSLLHEPAGADFPAYSAPAPSFLSGGPERPPRSI